MIPDRDYNYVVESQNFARVLEKGKLTGGIPYITIGYGNLYRIMDSYDSETGILNMSRFMVEPKVLGNACSGGATMGWARCINSIPRFQWTWGMTHANGFLKNDMALKGALPSSALQKFADGSHTVELSVQLGNGLRPVFYTGILKAE